MKKKNIFEISNRSFDEAIKNAHEAGRVYELSTLAESTSAAESIIAEAVERVAIRETIVQGAKTGRIVIKDPNVQFHVMQEKHAWDKVLKLSGNVQEDFKKVVAILEENNIFDKSFLKDKPRLYPDVTPKISKAEYEIVINNWQVHVEFRTYLETGETFLQNAWVITK